MAVEHRRFFPSLGRTPRRGPTRADGHGISRLPSVQRNLPYMSKPANRCTREPAVRGVISRVSERESG